MSAVITGMHAIMYAKDAPAARALFKDILKFPSVDAGGGWLIFALPPSELGVHPLDHGQEEGRHEMYLMCGDIERTVAELRERGVEFTRPVSDQGWGLLTTMRVPGAGEIGLYQPRHPTALSMNHSAAVR